MSLDPDHINIEWHENKPHSFGGKYRSYDYYKGSPKEIIDKAFKKNNIYTKFFQYRRSKYHNPTYVYRKREQIQVDTIVFPDPLMLKATKNTKYLLVFIDVFTKYAWLYPLKQIKGADVAKCFSDLFRRNKPEKLTSDAGKEFLNKHVQKVLRENKVQYYIAKGRTKAAVAERFNLTIQRLIYQLCRYHNTNEWTSDLVLGKAKKIYLNRKHRTIKMSPIEAEKKSNQSRLRKVYLEKYRKAKSFKKKPKFNIGDTVRISSKRSPFNRGYHQNFTTEVWTISKVMDNLPLPRYIVKDEHGDELDNVLNENEVIHYLPSDVYEIEKVLKTRWRNGRKEAFVRWLHLDKKFDSWVDFKDIVNSKY